MCEAELSLFAGEESDTRAKFESMLNEHSQAADDFAGHLAQPSSSYHMMLAKQSYLLSVARLIKRISEAYGFEDIYEEACCFETAARSYIDESDQRAFHQDLDKRFDLSDDWRGFLLARLMKRARSAERISAFYRKRIGEADDLEILALKYMLDLILDLPVGAWECAPCLAANGRCDICDYGRDHEICSQPGSTFEMLSRSGQSMADIMRRSIKDQRIESLSDPIVSSRRPSTPIQKVMELSEDGDCANLCDS